MSALFLQSDFILLDGKDEGQVDGAAVPEDGQEEVLMKKRAKLFEFDAANSKWMTKATGDASLLRSYDQTKARVRFMMRRDKTMRICANHWITKDMKLQSIANSDRSWVWRVTADLAEQLPEPKHLGIRFASPEIAMQFKQAFEGAQDDLNTDDKLSQLELLRLERDRISRQITLLEAQIGDGK
ncbi:hypothetical protein GALMADRAFT_241895 [Galerina marginata CBS 339.88]|uniref:RanBD1 domain-containing protein n=1 Tax=Galerina marginata (strain CBS 339.88) TaxID=685588 RepID=A0A067TBS7_GALM3|nr:hypothetical protein GALMADRAFT_241895 [Galerina marginata CBS 339.88]